MLRPHVMKLVQDIESTASEILRLEERAAEACERIRTELGYHFVAVQMTDPSTKVIRTIYGSDDVGRWYNLGAHPIDVSEELRDIQAHVALHEQPIIEVIKGWHPAFDNFIYRKFRHARYLRAFVPLVVVRDAMGSFREAQLAWFVPPDPAVPPVKASADSYQTICLHPRCAPQSYIVIGTIEAGYDCERGSGDYEVDQEKAIKLFALACQEAAKLFRSTIPNVLQVIADSTRKIAGADLVFYEFADENKRSAIDKRFDVWSGSREKYIEYKDNVEKLRLPRTAGESNLTTLYLAFRKRDARQANHASRAVQEQSDAIELFLLLAQDALMRASHSIRSATSARQLANLHEIAIALADEPESDDLLHTIAGHTANLLAADVVSIHELRSGRCEESVGAGRTVGKGEANSPLRRQPSSQLVRELGRSLIKPAVNVESLARLIEATPEEIRAEQLCCGAAALLRANEYTFGMMLVAYRRPHDFSPEELKTIQTVASTAAVAIRNRIVARTRRHNLRTLIKELEEAEELARIEHSTRLMARLDGLLWRVREYTQQLI